MAIPKLSNLGEALKGLSPLDLRMLTHVYVNWENFQAYAKLADLSRINRSAAEARNKAKPRESGADYVRARLDEFASLGYISKHTTIRGAHFYLPKGVWEKLPPFCTQPWCNPTKRSLERAAELLAEYEGTRIIRDERKTNWRSDDEIYMDEREGSCAPPESKGKGKDDDSITLSPKAGPPGQESVPSKADDGEAVADDSEGVDQ